MIRRLLGGLAVGFGLVLGVGGASADLIKKRSPHDVATTLDRLEKILKRKGLTVFARIDHAKGAASVKMALRPTALIIFGNPKLGTSLMQTQQTAGIDLPMKALAWRDASGFVWLAYERPADMARNRGIDPTHKAITTMTGALEKMTDAALKP
ncbi:MAG: DUF302 domain-containing protein [Pseudomonadota bacterium]